MSASTGPDPDAVRELNAAAFEPFLPAEKRLVFGSLALGAVLLGLLLWVCKTYFPAG